MCRHFVRLQNNQCRQNIGNCSARVKSHLYITSNISLARACRRPPNTPTFLFFSRRRGSGYFTMLLIPKGPSHVRSVTAIRHHNTHDFRNQDACGGAHFDHTYLCRRSPDAHPPTLEVPTTPSLHSLKLTSLICKLCVHKAYRMVVMPRIA
jgi:hypothetical protein